MWQIHNSFLKKSWFGFLLPKKKKNERKKTDKMQSLKTCLPSQQKIKTVHTDNTKTKMKHDPQIFVSKAWSIEHSF